MFKKKTASVPKDTYRYSKELNMSYVDIQIDSYTELYNEWDFSPYANRDIDEDLYEYLEEAAFEISKKHFICIVFNIPRSLQNEEKEKESRIGFSNYFAYRLRRQTNKGKVLKRQAAYYGLFGLFLLSVGMFADSMLSAGEYNSYLSLLTEGLYIGGWVLFWELFNIIFFELGELSDTKKMLTRLKNAEIAYNYR